MKPIEYKGYLIIPNTTGYVNFDFYLESNEKITGHGKTVEDCKNQIDEIIEDDEYNEAESDQFQMYPPEY